MNLSNKTNQTNTVAAYHCYAGNKTKLTPRPHFWWRAIENQQYNLFLFYSERLLGPLHMEVGDPK